MPRQPAASPAEVSKPPLEPSSTDQNLMPYLLHLISNSFISAYSIQVAEAPQHRQIKADYLSNVADDLHTMRERNFMPSLPVINHGQRSRNPNIRLRFCSRDILTCCPTERLLSGHQAFWEEYCISQASNRTTPGYIPTSTSPKYHWENREDFTRKDNCEERSRNP